MARVFLVDGSNHAFRVHFALPPMHAADGFPTRALYGFTTLFAKMLRVHEPDYVVVAFDSGKTFRHELYADYKGNRPDMPEELRAQWPHLPSLVEGFGYRAVVKEGYEADDLLATLAERFKSDLEVCIVTGDKDLGQLVDDRVRILDLMKDRELGAPEIEEKLGVPPEQVVDALALAGDSSDNVPGVPGIGMKTAAKYLKKYPNLDEVLAAAADGEIGGKRGQSLVDHAEDARLSRDLVLLHRDVPLELSLEDIEPRGLQVEDLRELFDRWDFGKVARNLLPKQKLVDRKIFRAVEDLEDLDGLLGRCREHGRVGICLELVSPEREQIAGIALATGADDAVYIPLAHPDQPLDGEAAWSMVQELLSSGEVDLLGHAIKRDLPVLWANGVTLDEVGGDTRLLDYMLFAHQRGHELEDMSQRFLGHYLRPYPEVENGRRLGMADLSPARAARYTAEQAHVVLRLHERLYERLSEGQRRVYEEIELPLVPVLTRMELRGIRLELEVLEQVSADIDARVKQAEQRCHELAGRSFNVASRHELREILFEELDLPPSKKVKDGWSTAQSVLEKLRDLHPLPGALLRYRSLAKLKSTYLDPLRDFVAEDGRVHTTFHQTVAATGRLSSSDPNLQNIPIRTEEGRRIRRCFLPGKGCVFLSADYSQIELRVLAHYCGESTLLQSFRDGIDIHRRTASEVFGLPMDEVGDAERSAAKAINFGLIYGMSAFRLSGDLDISREEAQHYMDEYFERLPGVQAWIEQSKEQAREQGYVETLFGRRRVLPGIHARRYNERMAAEREAVNTRVQGTAADLIKRAMLRVSAALREHYPRTQLLLQVHDELLLELPEAEVEGVTALVVEHMAGAADLDVPLQVNTAVGEDWYQAHG